MLGPVPRAPQARAVHGHRPRPALENPEQPLQSARRHCVDHAADRVRTRRFHQAERAAAARPQSFQRGGGTVAAHCPIARKESKRQAGAHNATSSTTPSGY